MIADEVAQYLAGAGLGLVVGFISSTSATGIYAVPFPPEAPDAAACVIEYGGSPPLDAFGPSLSAPVMELTRIQVSARDKAINAGTARALMDSINKKLRHFSGTMTGSTGGTVTYNFVKALQPPFFLKYDENQRAVYAVNVECMKAES